MKATIKLEQQKRVAEFGGGWFSKKVVREMSDHVVIITLELSEEERAILTEYNLWDYLVYNEKTYEPALSRRFMALLEAEKLPPETWTEGLPVRIRDLTAGDGMLNFWEDTQAALNFQTQVKEKFLPNIKRLMDESHKRVDADPDVLEF